MDNNQENETFISEQKKNAMNKTQNTFLSTGSSRKFNFRVSSSTDKNKYLPPINTSTSDLNNFPNSIKKTNHCFPLKHNLIKKNNELNLLMQRLTDNRMDINQKNNELTELKIKYSKLLEENKYTKNLLAEILGVDAGKEFSKKEIVDKIEKCAPTENQQRNLKYAYDIIKLKFEINDKREKISEVNKQIDYYTKNAKSRTITDLEIEYMLKSNHQNQIQKLIDKLQIIVDENKIKLGEIKKQYKTKKELNIKLKSEFSETDKKLREIENEREKLDNIVLELREKQRKMHDKLKVKKYKNENEEAILFKKIDLENIESYIKKRDIIFKDIETRKNNIKILEKEKMDLDKVIKELSLKNNELSKLMDNYNKEGPKLIQKSYEPLNNQRNMRDLEEKLKIFRKEYELTQKIHVEKQKELQEILDQLNEEIEENLKVINKNNDEKNKLNGEIDELSEKIDNNNIEIKEKINKINITKNEMEDYLLNEEKNKKEEEEKEKMNEEENKKNEEARKKEQLKKEREYKKELDSIKKEIDKYKNENKYTKEENDNLKKEIEEFDKTINECENIDEKIKEALDQLEQLKSG